MRILGISGSLQAESANLSLLKTIAGLAPSGVQVLLFDGLRHLPHFDVDRAAEHPPAVLDLRRAVATSDALIIASPEYAFSLPGALKNGIDWLIGTGELERKVVAITAAVNHPERGRRGLEALRNTLTAVSARIVGGEPVVRGPSLEEQAGALLRAVIRTVTEPPDLSMESAQVEPTEVLGGPVTGQALLDAFVETFGAAGEHLSLALRDGPGGCVHVVPPGLDPAKRASRHLLIELTSGAVAVTESLRDALGARPRPSVPGYGRFKWELTYVDVLQRWGSEQAFAEHAAKLLRALGGAEASRWEDDDA